jgi:hypothetical protein
MTKTAMKKYGIDDKTAEQIDAIAKELARKSLGSALEIRASVTKFDSDVVEIVEFIIYFDKGVNPDFVLSVCMSVDDIAKKAGAMFDCDVTPDNTEEAEAYERDAFVVWKR